MRYLDRARARSELLVAKSTVVLFGGLMAANAGNFLFHALESRLVGPESYGAITSMLNVLLALTLPAGALQVLVVREVAARSDGDDCPVRVRTLLGRACGVASIAAVAMVVVARPLSDYLRIGSVVPVTIVALFLVIAATTTVLRGTALGCRRYGVVAGAAVAGSAIQVVAAFALFPPDVTGAMLAVLAGEVMTAAILATSCWSALSGHGPEVAVPLRRTSCATGALLGFWCLAGADVVFARHFLGGVGAGGYAAAAFICRTVLFLPATVAAAAVPSFADPDPGRAASALRTAVRAALALGVSGAVIVVLAGAALTHGVFGARYAAAPSLLVPLVVAACGLGLLNVIVQYGIARRARFAWGPWVGLIALAVIVIASHGSPASVAADLVVATLIAVIVELGVLDCEQQAGLPRFTDETLTALGDPAELDVTIVVPFYNPGPQLRGNLFRLLEVLRAQNVTFEVIAVADGCTDGSEATIAGLEPGVVRQVIFNRNQGKGKALRAGMALGRGRFIGFIDADGDLDFTLWGPFIELMRLYDAAVVIGSKRHPLSQVACSPVRRLYSLGYQSLVGSLFRLPVRDTQTGIKLVRRDVLSEVLPRLREDRFAFDLELLAVAHRLGHHQFFEAPVSITRRSGSTVSTAAVWRTFRDTLAIAYRLHIARVYDRPVVRAEEPAAPSRVHMSDRPMRILVCNWKDVTHPAAGGAEFYTQEVLQRWASAGHHVTMFASEVAGQPATDDLNGVRVIRRGGRYTVYAAAREFYAQRAGSFDVVVDEVNTRPFGCATWVRDVPVIALIHQVARDIWSQEFGWPLGAIGRYVLEPWWLAAYQDVPTLTISPSSRESLRQAGLRQVSIVPTGVTLPYDLPLPRKADEPTIMFLGRLSPNKRPDHVVEAFRQVRSHVPECQLWVVGRGPLENRLRANAVEGVTFFGRVEECEKFELLAAAHALVVTSVREGWGLVVDEAAAVGTRTVAYRTPGLADSVPAADGVLVDPDPSSLASALVRLLPLWAAQPPATGWRGGARDWDDVARDILAHLHRAVGSSMNSATPAGRLAHAADR